MKDTIRLYQQNVYQSECESKVLEIISDPKDITTLGGKDDEGTLCLLLDQTIFFPEGGGQPCDVGLINCIPVLYVFEKNGLIYHQVRLGATEYQLKGKSVSCKIDWDKRFSNMQRHCGEHILSAVFHALYGGVNRGFHMGSDYMTIDISLEQKEEYSELTDEMMLESEREANRMVWANLPVTTRYFDKREDADHLPMRKKLTIDENIILVCVGDESNPSGCVACCGTHPRTTGEVGLIKLYKWENYKGMTRITFDAGLNALAHCQDESEINKSLCRHYSTDLYSLLDTIRAQELKNKEVRQELYEIKKEYIKERVNEILDRLDENVVVREYPKLKTDDLLSISRQLPKDLSNLIVLISPTENTIILICGGSYDCGKIVKDNAHVWGGKGGGRTDNARAMFSSRQDMDCFIDYLKKAY